jgi:hypothetical protein
LDIRRTTTILETGTMHRSKTTNPHLAAGVRLVAVAGVQIAVVVAVQAVAVAAAQAVAVAAAQAVAVAAAQAVVAVVAVVVEAAAEEENEAFNFKFHLQTFIRFRINPSSCRMQ